MENLFSVNFMFGYYFFFGQWKILIFLQNERKPNKKLIWANKKEKMSALLQTITFKTVIYLGFEKL